MYSHEIYVLYCITCGSSLTWSAYEIQDGGIANLR